MKTLPPQRLRQADWADIERQLVKIFREVIYDPLAKILQPALPDKLELKNDKFDDLRKALSRGRIEYAAGVFSGRFSASISVAIRSFGGKLDKRSSTYKIKPTAVPTWVREAAAQYKMEVRDINENIKKRLDEIQKNLPEELGAREIDATSAIKSVSEGFDHVARSMTVKPTLSEKSKEDMAKNYSTNLDLWVKKFTEREILELREIAEENAQKGVRAEFLADKIRRRFGVSASKAKFLAQQETSLFMSKFRAQRFGDAGVKRYIWRTSGDVKVRSDHKKLNGRIFSYTDPPVVDEATGRKGNPGEDYGCRCVDQPILEPVGISS